MKELQNSTLIQNTLKRKENANHHFLSLSSSLSSFGNSNNINNNNNNNNDNNNNNNNNNKEDKKGLKEIFEEKWKKDEWEWALSTLWSRAFSIKVNEREMGSLVPLADLFNAYNPITQPLSVTARFTSSSLKYFTILPISKGDQVLLPLFFHFLFIIIY